MYATGSHTSPLASEVDPLRILLVNVPHPAIGSRIPKEQLPPLGLLSVGGPLLDDGHQVQLLDGEFGPRPLADIIDKAVRFAPDLVLFGHSGSSSAQPVIAKTAALLRARSPQCRIIYGGVHPTYFWREILAEEPWVDVIVRGGGEAVPPTARIEEGSKHDCDPTRA